MNLALNERWDEASVLMENTYIPELPDGTGVFLFYIFCMNFSVFRLNTATI